MFRCRQTQLTKYAQMWRQHPADQRKESCCDIRPELVGHNLIPVSCSAQNGLLQRNTEANTVVLLEAKPESSHRGKRGGKLRSNITFPRIGLQYTCQDLGSDLTIFMAGASRCGRGIKARASVAPDA